MQSAGCTLTRIWVCSLRGKSLLPPLCPPPPKYNPVTLISQKPLRAALSLLPAHALSDPSPSPPPTPGCCCVELRLEITRLTSEEPQGAVWPPAPTPAGATLGNARPRAADRRERGTREAHAAPLALARNSEGTASLGLRRHPGGEKRVRPASQRSRARRGAEGELGGGASPRALTSGCGRRPCFVGCKSPWKEDLLRARTDICAKAGKTLRDPPAGHGTPRGPACLGAVAASFWRGK